MELNSGIEIPHGSAYDNASEFGIVVETEPTKSSGDLTRARKGSVDLQRIDGHCERLLRLPDSFRAHCGDPTF